MGDETKERWLRLLVKSHGRAVEGCIARLERDAAVREEIWSEVFTLAYRNINELSETDSPGARRWLRRVAELATANVGRRAATRRKATERLEREPPTWMPSAEDEYLTQAAHPASEARQSSLIRTALSSLSAHQREILLLDALGESGPMIAERMHISHQAARSRLMRSRAAFVVAYRAAEAERDAP